MLIIYLMLPLQAGVALVLNRVISAEVQRLMTPTGRTPITNTHVSELALEARTVHLEAILLESHDKCRHGLMRCWCETCCP